MPLLYTLGMLWATASADKGVGCKAVLQANHQEGADAVFGEGWILSSALQ